MPSLLIVDDEANIRSTLRGALAREGYSVDDAPSLEAARVKLREAFDLVLLDVAFPQGNGLVLLQEILADAPETRVIMMSGHASIETAVQATRMGAFDFLEKPLSLERLLVVLKNALDTRALASENRRLRAPWAAGLVGRSPALQKLLDAIALAGPSEARVLITGENGTGKELVARALHEASPRRARPFVAVNCSAIPDELFESELFGHEKGAFTGATQARLGHFEEAQSGTLFLDEIGDLPLRAQTKLLRVLEANELTRVGGSRTIKVDVRVLAATNRDLEAMCEAGTFRRDLYFRLMVLPLHVVPLRERREDLPLLIEHFVARYARDRGQRAPRFDDSGVQALMRHAFPGNVRELKNLVERLVIMNPGATIGAAEVAAVLGTAAAGVPSDLPETLSEAVRAFERRTIEAALAAEGGVMTRAAARLGLERSHLYKKMRQLGMRVEG